MCKYFTTAKIWNQHKWLKIKKIWYLFIVEYYLVSGKKIPWFIASWMNLEDTMLSEISYA